MKIIEVNIIFTEVICYNQRGPVYKTVFMFAKGIPKKNDYSFPKSTDGTWELAIQEHDAKRAGKHYDIRLVNKDTNVAYSWATKNELPKPKEKILAVQQPLHTGTYAHWSGTISEGYGKGDVKLKTIKPIEVIEATKDKIKFIIPEGRVAQEYALIRTNGKNWLLLNHSTTVDKYPISHHKPAYKETSFDSLLDKPPEGIITAKIDGAHSVVILQPGKTPRVFSYRKSARNVPLEYTFKMPPEFYGSRWPKSAPPMIIRAEIFGVDKTGKAIKENILGRILNSNLENAREIIKQLGIQMQLAPFQIERIGNKPVEIPYTEQLKILKDVTKKLPDSILPAYALTPKDKRKLLQQIRSGKLKQTSEGVVVWNDKGPTKAKIKPDFDVYVRKIFKETGNRNLAGGFEYSLTPKGPIVGRVGTGFSHSLKEFMLKHPERVKGLVARVNAMYQFPSGALRAPAFKGWHYEKSGERATRVPQR